MSMMVFSTAFANLNAEAELFTHHRYAGASLRSSRFPGQPLHDQILMLSGVGSSSHLHKFGIPVLCDLPGVGSHLVDHPVVDMYFKDRHNVSTKHIKPRTLYEVSQIIGSTVQYLITRRGPLATNVSHSISYSSFCL